MKKLALIIGSLAVFSAYANTFDFTYFGTHNFMSAVQSPQNLCYPPNPPEQNPYFSYFASDRCYHQFRSTCDQAQLVKFDSSSTPNQANNNYFYSLCNTTDINQQLGPEFVLWVDPNNTSVTHACILLANPSATSQSTVQVNVFFDPSVTPNPSIHAPGCLPNEVAIYAGQSPTAPNTFTMQCANVQDSTHVTNRTSVIPNLQSFLNNNYTKCPSIAITHQYQ